MGISLFNKCLIGTIVFLFLVLIVVTGKGIALKNELLVQKQQVKELKENLDTTRGTLERELLLNENYKKQIKEQQEALEKNKQEYQTYKEALATALVINQKWAKQELPQEVSEALSKRNTK